MAEPEGDLLTAGAVEGNQEQTTQWYPQEYSEKITQKGWTEPTEAVKSYFELEKAMGGRVKIPTEDSTEDEINAFYKKTGRPENPDGYEINVPEELDMLRDESMEAWARQALFEGGASKALGEKIIQGWYEKVNADLAASKEAGERELKQEFAAQYDENIAIADRYFATCSPEFIDLCKRMGLASNPVFIKEFLNKGKQTMADTLVKGTQDNPDDKGYKPAYPDSPSMYAGGDDEESKKARAYFEARGHKY
jgi:hypothetical protein